MGLIMLLETYTIHCFLITGTKYCRGSENKKKIVLAILLTLMFNVELCVPKVCFYKTREYIICTQQIYILN